MIRAAERAVRPRALAAVLVAALATAVAPVARAQGGSASARADALFTQGKAALESGDYAHACPALQDSYAIDPANGTLLALALCHEGVGRTATAWRELRTAAEGATRDGRADRAQFAQSHIAKLEARLSRVTVVVPADAPAGLVVEVDGAPLAQAEWDKASPIDPGHHIVTAHAPGRKSWSVAVDVGPEHDAQTVAVGALAADTPTPLTPAPPGAPATDSVPSAEGSAPGAWKRPVGWTLGGVGLAAIGVGTYFGVSAISKSNDAKSQCSPSNCASPAAVSENGDAKTAATIADVAIGVGIAAAAAGVYLLFTAPSAPAPSTAVRVAPFVGRHQAGVALEQAW